MIVAFHKPYGVLSQFTPDGSPNRPLADFGFPAGVYPIGRLDADSEGLLLLSDEPHWNQQLLDPEWGHRRTYWVQVERVPTPESLRKLEAGVTIQGRKTLPCRVRLLETAPELPPRDPPIRFRKTVPDAWLEMELIEGKNRQVRRMTAFVGHPTLRLVRARIGNLECRDLKPGQWRALSDEERSLLEAGTGKAGAVMGNEARSPQRSRPSPRPKSDRLLVRHRPPPLPPLRNPASAD
jgi:23S rRNA pseudouridine2457 synthase